MGCFYEKNVPIQIQVECLKKELKASINTLKSETRILDKLEYAANKTWRNNNNMMMVKFQILMVLVKIKCFIDLKGDAITNSDVDNVISFVNELLVIVENKDISQGKMNDFCRLENNVLEYIQM